MTWAHRPHGVRTRANIGATCLVVEANPVESNTLGQDPTANPNAPRS